MKPQAKPAPRLPAFVPLVMAPGTPAATLPVQRDGSAGSAIEVVLRNGRRLRVGVDADIATVARLAAALEA